MRALVVLLAAVTAAGCTMDFRVFRRDGAVPEDQAFPSDEPTRPDGPEPLDARDAAPPDASADGPAGDRSLDGPPPFDAPPDVPGPDAPPDTVRPDVPPPMDAPPDVPTCPPVLRVNEVQTGTTASGADEFVEIYNAGTCDVALYNFTLRYSSASGATTPTYWTGTAVDHVAPGGYVVIGGASFTAVPVIGRFTSSGLADTGGSVAIFSNDGTRLDSVAYGSITAVPVTSHPFVETAPAPAPPRGQSIARIPNGSDTNNNSTDFMVRPTPSPGAVNM